MATLEEMQARYRDLGDEYWALKRARRHKQAAEINLERNGLRGKINRALANETADDYANRILATVDLDTPMPTQTPAATFTAEQVLMMLLKVVNGATRTMGQNSCGQDYAHISQDVLDAGRDMLHMAGVANVSERY